MLTECLLELKMSFGDNLKRLRRDKGWTQGQLADAADLKVGHIPKLEASNSDPKMSTIYKLITALGCSADTLLMDTDKIGTDGLLKASLERMQQLPETQKYILIDIVDAYCIRHSIQSNFKRDGFKIMLFKDQPKGILNDEQLEKELSKDK
jgi:transcriptional regulator with XRE-family HTH domain